MKKLLFVVMVLSQLNYANAVAIKQSTGTVNQKIGLTQQSFIVQLKKTHPFFAKQAISQQLVANQENTALAGQDWQVTVSANQHHQQTDHLDSITTYGRNNQTNLNSRIERSFYNTGAKLGFEHQLSKTSTSRVLYGNSFAVNYSHPLWRNKNGINDQLNTDIARLELTRIQLALYDESQLFLLSQLESLVDLSLLQAQESIQQQRLKIAEDELSLVQRKFVVSLVEQIDVLSQQDTLLGIQAQLLSTQQHLLSLKESLAITLELPIDKITSAFDLYQQQPIKILINSNYLTRNHHRLKAIAVQKRQLQRQLLSNKNEKRPDLSLQLGATRAGENRTLSGSLFVQSPQINIGLNLSFPLNNSLNTAQRKTLLLNLKNLEQTNKDTLRTLQANANSLNVQLSKIKRILASNRKQIKVAKARTQQEKRRYKDGLIETNFLISAQNNEQNIALNYAQNCANYHRLYLQYQALLNQL